MWTIAAQQAQAGAGFGTGIVPGARIGTRAGIGTRAVTGAAIGIGIGTGAGTGAGIGIGTGIIARIGTGAGTGIGIGARARAPGRGVAEASRGGGGGGGGERAVARRSARISSRRPAVQSLAKEELSRLLPWSGCGERLATEVGDLEACIVRVALSLVACALVYNTSIEVASVAGFYWAWAPILGTALPNLLLRLRYRYAGIWSAQVLEVKVSNPPKFVTDESGDLLGMFFNRLPKIPSTLQLVIGDGSAAIFRMEVPLADNIPVVQAGDRVTVMVASDDPSFSRFKVLRDLYLPDREAWLSEEPCIERQPFEELQKSLSPPVQSFGSKGGNGRRSQLQLEENTLSRDKAPWEKTLRRDFSMEEQTQRNKSIPGRELELDYDDSYSEKEGRKRAKALDYDDLYL